LREADEDAERTQQREVLVGVDACSWGGQQQRALTYLAGAEITTSFGKGPAKRRLPLSKEARS